MTENMLESAGTVLAVLDSLDGLDRSTILAMINSRYPQGTAVTKTTSVGKKAGKGGGDTKSNPKTEKKEETEEDLLTKVMLRLKPLIVQLPKVDRQQGAEKPHMDLKSVQKRLNRKRADLHKELSALSEQPDEAWLAFQSLNRIQGFRIAAKDASTTKGCRLPTNPIPEGFDELVDVLEKTAISLIESGDVSSNGFFTDENHKFSAPLNRGPTGYDSEQTTSKKEVVW
jgi:hypothetical protein